jgi:hypothetical protein
MGATAWMYILRSVMWDDGLAQIGTLAMPWARMGPGMSEEHDRIVSNILTSGGIRSLWQCLSVAFDRIDWCSTMLLPGIESIAVSRTGP